MANIHLKGVTVQARFTLPSFSQFKSWNFPSPPFMHRLDFLKLCKYSSKPDFCLIWNAMLFRPKYRYQYYLILKRFRHDVRTQLSCGITNSQAGKESPQAFKEQQQVLEKFLLAPGCELRPLLHHFPLHQLCLYCPGYTDPAPVCRFFSDSRKPKYCKIIIKVTKPHGIKIESWGRKVMPLIQNKPSSSHRRSLKDHTVNKLSLCLQRG